VSNRDNQRREIGNTLSGAADLLNEVRVQVNLALVRAEGRLREFLATNDDTVVIDEPNTAVA
jgi:hypothetical protein